MRARHAASAGEFVGNGWCGSRSVAFGLATGASTRTPGRRDLLDGRLAGEAAVHQPVGRQRAQPPLRPGATMPGAWAMSLPLVLTSTPTMTWWAVSAASWML